MLGPVSEYLKENNLSSKSISTVIRATELKEFHKLTKSKGFISSKTKQALLEYLTGKSLSDIEKDSTYFVGDVDALNKVVLEVLSTNQDKIKNSDESKILNWLVGQVMKQVKGKADPAEVKTLIEKHMLCG